VRGAGELAQQRDLGLGQAHLLAPAGQLAPVRLEGAAAQ
jgi:hypothetical protein